MIKLYVVNYDYQAFNYYALTFRLKGGIIFNNFNKITANNEILINQVI